MNDAKKAPQAKKPMPKKPMPKPAGMVRVHYRLVKGHTGIYDTIIRWFTRSPYTHAEFCWPLENPRPPQYLGAQPNGGVQVRPFDYLGNQSYDTFAVDLTPDQADVLRKIALSQVGTPYDFRAIAGMVVPGLDRGRRADALYCSEQLFYDFVKVEKRLLNATLKQSDRITPRDLSLSTVATLVFSWRPPA